MSDRMITEVESENVHKKKSHKSQTAQTGKAQKERTPCTQSLWTARVKGSQIQDTQDFSDKFTQARVTTNRGVTRRKTKKVRVC